MTLLHLKVSQVGIRHVLVRICSDIFGLDTDSNDGAGGLKLGW